jgi:hypothetical protein
VSDEMSPPLRAAITRLADALKSSDALKRRDETTGYGPMPEMAAKLKKLIDDDKANKAKKSR